MADCTVTLIIFYHEWLTSNVSSVTLLAKVLYGWHWSLSKGQSIICKIKIKFNLTIYLLWFVILIILISKNSLYEGHSSV